MRKDRTYRDLKVYQTAFHYSMDMVRFTSEFQDQSNESLIENLRNSAQKVSIKIAEGWMRKQRETGLMEHLGEARKSLDELKLWLKIGQEYNCFSTADFHSWTHGANKIEIGLSKLENYWLTFSQPST
jgi:four helix bundle protein